MEAIQTAAFWDASSADYVVGAEPFTSCFCEDAVAIAAIAPGTKLLDVATGPGALALAAARNGAEVVAIDFSSAMIDRLRARIGSLPIVARQMDGQALQLPDRHFDWAASVFGVPLFPDFRAGLREMTRVIRSGGRAVIAVADNPWGFGPNRLLADARADLFPDSPAPAMTDGAAVLATEAGLVAELEAAGLTGIDIQIRTHDLVAEPQLMRANSPMIGANPVLAGLDEDDRARAISLAADRAVALAQDGVLRMPSTARFAIGTRP